MWGRPTGAQWFGQAVPCRHGRVLSFLMSPPFLLSLWSLCRKSTFFNVLTESAIPAENFPFCTKGPSCLADRCRRRDTCVHGAPHPRPLDPNEARVAVPDERFDFLCDFHKPASKIPAYLNVVDIAGLVKGAHEGEVGRASPHDGPLSSPRP